MREIRVCYSVLNIVEVPDDWSDDQITEYLSGEHWKQLMNEETDFNDIDWD